jgi:hypothetical protein
METPFRPVRFLFGELVIKGLLKCKQCRQMRYEKDPEPYPLRIVKKEMNVTLPFLKIQTIDPLILPLP